MINKNLKIKITNPIHIRVFKAENNVICLKKY